MFCLLVSSPSRKPVGFSLHLGWCCVTERPWSHNAAITTTAPSSRLQAALAQLTPQSPASSLYLCAEPGTRPPQLPHDSPSGALDKVSKVRLVRDVCVLCFSVAVYLILKPRVSTPHCVFCGRRTFVATFLTFTSLHLIFLWLSSCLLYAL